MTVEIWQPVPSVPGYEASNLGRVRAAEWRSSTRAYGGVAWLGSWTGKRYIVRFRGKTYKVARLVCEAFHGPPPPGRPLCLHLDEDARNNRADNLKWGTQKENLNMPKFLTYCRSRTGDNNPYRKGRT
jgi:hypothetical protein